jgi:hypothetical protein
MASDDRVWRKLYNLVRKAAGKSVRVGLFDGELAEIGAVHEYGSADGTIPERSWLRSTFRSRREDLAKMQARVTKAMLAGKITETQAMELLGQWAAGAVKQTIQRDGEFAPLAPATVEAKGSTRPLVDTGQLAQSIAYKVGDE